MTAVVLHVDLINSAGASLSWTETVSTAAKRDPEGAAVKILTKRILRKIPEFVEFEITVKEEVA